MDKFRKLGKAVLTAFIIQVIHGEVSHVTAALALVEVGQVMHRQYGGTVFGTSGVKAHDGVGRIELVGL